MSEDLKELVGLLDNCVKHAPENSLCTLSVEAVSQASEAITRLVGEVEGPLTMTGCRDQADLIDMANVGRSLMERMGDLIESEGPFKGWSPADAPGEIVTDLSNAYDEALAREHALSLRVGELEEGLRPFAKAFTNNPGWSENAVVPGVQPATWDAFRQASRLLSEGVSSATVDPVKVEAATPLAGQAEKYLALPIDRQIALADDLKDRLVAHIAGREKLDDEEKMLVNIAQVNMLLQHARHALSAPPLKGGEDTARLDWLEKHVVNVREPLVHGSRDLFWSNPDESIEGEEGPSDIRAKIDRALEEQS